MNFARNSETLFWFALTRGFSVSNSQYICYRLNDMVLKECRRLNAIKQSEITKLIGCDGSNLVTKVLLPEFYIFLLVSYFNDSFESIESILCNLGLYKTESLKIPEKIEHLV